MGPGAAVWLCGALAVVSVLLACLGSARSSALMARPPLLALTALLALGLAYTGARSLSRGRVDSALLHVGFACVLAGWLVGRAVVNVSTGERPAGGYMALWDGYVSDELSNERETVGKVPFSVRLMRFSIDRYEASAADREAGRMPPVKEYCSLVLISEPGKKPYAKKIRVNHPAYVRGYHIYQNSYRETSDNYGRPMLVTILQFVRDPGLPIVYAGFALLFAGVALFAARLGRAGKRDAGSGVES